VHETTTLLLVSQIFTDFKKKISATPGGIFKVHLNTNLPKNLPVKKSVKICQNYGAMSLWPYFFWPTMYINRISSQSGYK